MTIGLVSHVNGDGDLLEAWFKYYIGLGVTSFHLIIHGPRIENARLLNLKSHFPVIICDSYDGEFRPEEKKRRVDSVLASMTGQWLLFADSDEFVEFPYQNIAMTVRMLELAQGHVLFAPMLQHMTADGSLNTPEIIDDPFHTFPLCSISLYEKMGNKVASINKYPLFYCTQGTAISDGGNHNPPLGAPPGTRSLLGVTHHFKFRRPLLQRLDQRINSTHSWRHESEKFRNYLEKHGNRLPLEDSFGYSREELFRRGLLRKFTLQSGFRWVFRKIARATSYSDV